MYISICMQYKGGKAETLNLKESRDRYMGVFKGRNVAIIVQYETTLKENQTYMSVYAHTHVKLKNDCKNWRW